MSRPMTPDCREANAVAVVTTELREVRMRNALPSTPQGDRFQHPDFEPQIVVNHPTASPSAGGRFWNRPAFEHAFIPETRVPLPVPKWVMKSSAVVA